MTALLFRVDERLIHGQVVVGWGRRLRPDRIVVVHDDLAESALERQIYETGMPEEIEASFWTVSEAIERLPEVIAGDERVFVLTEDLTTMERLVEAGIPIEEINLGGLHAAPEREEILPYVHLGPGDTARIRALEASGVEVIARDVPGGDSVRLVRRLA